jgi:hypothetical protein
MTFTEDGSKPDALITCPPDSDCCQLDHGHDQACKGGHGECSLAKCSVLTPEGEECPGGHCGIGVEGCTACRSLKVTLVRF